VLLKLYTLWSCFQTTAERLPFALVDSWQLNFLCDVRCTHNVFSDAINVTWKWCEVWCYVATLLTLSGQDVQRHVHALWVDSIKTWLKSLALLQQFFCWTGNIILEWLKIFWKLHKISESGFKVFRLFYIQRVSLLVAPNFMQWMLWPSEGPWPTGSFISGTSAKFLNHLSIASYCSAFTSMRVTFSHCLNLLLQWNVRFRATGNDICWRRSSRMVGAASGPSARLANCGTGQRSLEIVLAATPGGRYERVDEWQGLDCLVIFESSLTSNGPQSLTVVHDIGWHLYYALMQRSVFVFKLHTSLNQKTCLSEGHSSFSNASSVFPIVPLLRNRVKICVFYFVIKGKNCFCLIVKQWNTCPWQPGIGCLFHELRLNFLNHLTGLHEQVHAGQLRLESNPFSAGCCQGNCSVIRE